MKKKTYFLVHTWSVPGPSAKKRNLVTKIRVLWNGCIRSFYQCINEISHRHRYSASDGPRQENAINKRSLHRICEKKKKSKCILYSFQFIIFIWWCCFPLSLFSRFVFLFIQFIMIYIHMNFMMLKCQQCKDYAFLLPRSFLSMYFFEMEYMNSVGLSMVADTFLSIVYMLRAFDGWRERVVFSLQNPVYLFIFTVSEEWMFSKWIWYQHSLNVFFIHLTAFMQWVYIATHPLLTKKTGWGIQVLWRIFFFFLYKIFFSWMNEFLILIGYPP